MGRGPDYFVIRRDTMQTLDGDYGLALFMAWLEFRIRDDHVTYERDGYRWWRVTREQMAEELCVSPKVARTMRDKALARGLIVAEEHMSEGWSDRAVSYRLNEAPRAAQSGQCQERPKRSDVPSSKEVKEHRGSFDSESFDAWWKVYPRKEAKAYSQRAYIKALRDVSPEDLLEATKRFASSEWSDRPREELKFCPLPSTWLNQQRWTDWMGSNDDLLAEVEQLVEEGRVSEVFKILGVKVVVPDFGDVGPRETLVRRREWLKSWWESEGRSVVAAR